MKKVVLFLTLLVSLVTIDMVEGNDEISLAEWCYPTMWSPSQKTCLVTLGESVDANVTLIIQPDETLAHVAVIYEYGFYIYGTVINHGTISSSSYPFENQGTIKNYGMINCIGGELGCHFFSTATSRIENYGELRNSARFFAEVGPGWSVEGFLLNKGSIHNYGDFVVSGAFENHDYVRNWSNGTMSTGLLDAQGGFIHNDGSLSITGKILTGAIVHNVGEISTYNILTNNGAFHNHNQFTIHNTFENRGYLRNWDTGVIRNGGLLDAQEGFVHNYGFLENSGTIQNYGANITNFGIMTNRHHLHNHAKFTNVGHISNLASIVNHELAEFINFSKFGNAGIIDNYGYFARCGNMYGGGEFNNHGVVATASCSSMYIPLATSHEQGWRSVEKSG